MPHAILVPAVTAGLAAFTLSVTGAHAQAATSDGILSAFFGLDDSPRLRANALVGCLRITGNDGMPVVFSRAIDRATLDPSDFRMTTRSGAVYEADCVILRPASEAGENRTVLVIGEYGSISDQPISVEIATDLYSADGAVNYRGARSDVIPLEAGPTLVRAEIVPQASWELGGRGDCPDEGVRTMVRVTWAGGVRIPGGAEIGEAEFALYRVTLSEADGRSITVAPFAVGDLHDNDNHHELCLDVEGTPLSVAFPAGALIDPRSDLNPDTTIAVTRPGPG